MAELEDLLDSTRALPVSKDKLFLLLIFVLMITNNNKRLKDSSSIQLLENP